MLEKLNEFWEIRTIQFCDGGADGVVEKEWRGNEADPVDPG